MQKKAGAQALMIDNLLCISDNNGYDSRTQMYMNFLQELREIRNDIQIPIILLAHPNAEGKLAWSSDAENLVDILIYMYDVSALQAQDPEKFKKSNLSVAALPDGHAHIAFKFQKNRDGITPRLEMDFHKEIQTFTPLNRGY
jgi:replicative DNA helicase